MTRWNQRSRDGADNGLEIGIIAPEIFPIHGVRGWHKHTYYLATGLAERGFEVEVFCMDTSDDQADNLPNSDLAVTTIDGREWSVSPLETLSFATLLFRERSELRSKDILHFQDMFGGFPLNYLASTSVYTPHGLEWFKHRTSPVEYALNLLEIVSARSADQIVSLGPGNTHEILDFLGVNRDKIREIPNGVDVDSFEPKPTDEYRDIGGEHDYTIVSISSLSEHKGVDLLIDAIGELSDELDLQLVVVGDGPQRDRLEQSAMGYPVEFVGRVDEDELPYYYSLGDIFCLPTLGEGMPLAILEAFACGTPVLSTETGSIPDIVTPETGRLVAPGSAAALADGIRQLLTSDLGSMSDHCRSLARNQYSWDVTVERTVELYRELSNEK